MGIFTRFFGVFSLDGIQTSDEIKEHLKKSLHILLHTLSIEYFENCGIV